MSNVATLPQQKQNFSLTPQSLSEAMEFAAMMSKSSIVPKDYQNNPGNILVAIQWGMELGLQPMQSMQNIAVINGRPAIWGDAMLALVRGSGLLESINEKISDTGCVCTVKRKGEDPVIREFTTEDAKKAGLQGKQGPWSQYPKRMLQLRARAFALRDVFPDVLRGIHIAEEAQDIPPEKNMGTADEVSEAKPDIAARVRQATGHESPAATTKTDKPPILAKVLEVIAASNTPEEMTAAGELCAKLVDGEDRDKARVAYRARMAELKKAAAEAAAAAEVATASQQQGGPTFAEIEAQIQAADSVAGVNAAQDLIRSVKDEQQRTELSEIAAKRIDALTPV
jgi:hypothetical protein